MMYDEVNVKASISILGTGAMGSALARALRIGGYPVAVWNRTKQKAEPLAADGARVADTVVEAIDGADIVIVNVRDYPATASFLHAANVAADLRGKTLVELTSGTPAEARAAADWATAQGARYLDGAILATPDLIGSPAALLVVAGDPSVSAAIADVLETIATVQHVGEDPGQANALDTAALSMMWGSLFGAVHAVAVCQAEGLDLTLLTEQWTASAPVVQALVTDFIQRTAAGRFDRDDATLATVATHYSALHHLVAVMEARQLDPSVVNGYLALFRKAEAAGKLDADFSTMATFMAAPTPDHPTTHQPESLHGHPAHT
ncbi:MAG: NAD(P)-binding domain-containing protein [Acidobacteriota bacterium]